MRVLKNIGIASLIIAVIFLLVNVIVFLWFVIAPQGLWGGFWFYLIITGGVSVLLYVLVFIIIALSKGSLENFGIIGIVAFLIFILIGATIEFGPTLFITKKLRDRYRYIEVSERYFESGKYEKAIKSAQKLYLSVPDTEKIKSGPWVLRNHFLRKEKGRMLLKDREYQAAINYAFCLEALGRELDKAERLYISCEKLAKDYFQSEAEYFIVPLIGRSRIHMYRSEIIEAERIYNEFTSYLGNLETNDLSMAISMMLVYSQFSERHGDKLKAENIRFEALATYKKSSRSKKSSFYLNLLLLVTSDYLRNESFDEAKQLLGEAAKIAKEKRKKTIYLDYLHQKTKYTEKLGLNEATEKLYKKSIRKSKRKSSIEKSTVETHYAGFLFREKRFSEARKHYVKAISTAKMGAGYNISLSQYLGVILTDYANENTELALEKAMGLDSLVKDQMDDYFTLLTSDEKAFFTQNLDRSLSVSNSIYLAIKDSLLAGNIYNNVLASKSIAFFSNQNTEQFLINTGRTKLLDEYKQTRSNKQQLEDRLLIQSHLDKELTARIDSISFAERSLIERISRLDGYKPFSISDVSWEDVLNSLQDNESAIEFVYAPVNPHLKGDIRYFALILNPQFTHPIIVPLFYEEKISSLVKVTGAIEDGINSIYSDSAGHRLYSEIWLPLKPYIMDSKKIFISVSGLLHQISFPALTLDEPGSVEMLSSTRVLTTRDSFIKDAISTSVLFGDIDYKHTSTYRTTSDLSLYRTIDNNHPSSLPGTKAEVEKIAELMDMNNVEALQLTGKMATEKSFIESSYLNPNIMHIATHGFYYPMETSIVLRDNIFNIKGDYSVISDPMQRSGLLFASSSTEGSLSSHTDGILTSNEISVLDLSGVDIAVLSACETGLGDIRGSEGVFGLQRAFKVAGAKSLVMSLWRVPDKQTSELMASFYKFYLLGYSAHESLKKAQLEQRKKYPAPFYWAAFMVVE